MILGSQGLHYGYKIHLSSNKKTKKGAHSPTTPTQPSLLVPLITLQDVAYMNIKQKYQKTDTHHHIISTDLFLSVELGRLRRYRPNIVEFEIRDTRVYRTNKHDRGNKGTKRVRVKFT